MLTHLKLKGVVPLVAEKSAWTLSVDHDSERDRALKKTPALADFRNAILKRDDYVCQGCGWRCKRGQDIHPITTDHRNRKSIDGWVTLCPFCHQCFHLPQAASTNGGSLIWLPEISQATLNLFAFGLFVAMDDPAGGYAGLAKSIFGELEARRVVMENDFGSSDPGLLAQLLLYSKDEAAKKTITEHVRLLPYPSRYKHYLSVWKKSLPEAEAWKGLSELAAQQHPPADLMRKNQYEVKAT